MHLSEFLNRRLWYTGKQENKVVVYLFAKRKSNTQNLENERANGHFSRIFRDIAT